MSRNGGIGGVRLRGSTLRAGVAVAIMCAALAACQDDAPADKPTVAKRATESGRELTVPGTTLSWGESATVPVGDDRQVLRVEVTDIVKGSPADLSKLERSTIDTPYYIRYELELLEGDSPYVRIWRTLHAWAGETPLTLVNVFVPFPLCEQKTFGHAAKPGTLVSGCATFVTPVGAPAPDRVVFENGEDYSDFESTEISWQ